MTKNILVIAAHPDDEVIGCGGTIAKLTHTGNNVHIVYLTDGVGARRGIDSQVNDEVYARQEAAKNAAKILGASSTVFGNFPDNRMDSVDLLDVIQFIEREVNKHQPEMVFTHHANDLNVDHCITHQAVVTACRPQPNHSVKTLLFFEVCSSTEWQTPVTNAPFLPNWFVDISEYVEVRMRALEMYAMELRPWPHSRSLKALTHWVHCRGASVGLEAAEAFMLGRTIF